MGEIIFYSILALLVIWFVLRSWIGVKGLRELDAASFHAAMKEAGSTILIDVRQPNEVKQGKIPSAINIPLGQIVQRLSEIPKEKHVFLYCRSGMRSRQAAKMLLSRGFEQVTHLKGGIMSWTYEIK